MEYLTPGDISLLAKLQELRLSLYGEHDLTGEIDL